MWPRKRFDIRPRDLAVGIYYCLRGVSQKKAREKLESFWAPDGDGLAFLSVRSGFDALWQALSLPPGSEVLITGINIPHMAEIIRQHGLVPVPVDLDLERMAPPLALLESLYSDRCRAVVVAHLFGGQVEMTPILQWARQKDLLVIEDCAQAFCGPQYRGHPEADVSMFSFGSIKTSTALGGALFRIRSRELRDRIRAVETRRPIQSRLRYFRTLLKYAGFHFLCRPVAFGAFVGGCRLLGVDYDGIIHGAVRGFPGTDWLTRIRHQPCGPLLALLLRRLRHFNPARLGRRVAQGELLLQLLGDRVFCPGRQALNRTHWVFPILVEDPIGITTCLQQAGFDAARTHSLIIIDPPNDSRNIPLAECRRLMAGLVCLPIYPEITEKAVRKMAEVVLGSSRPRPVLVHQIQAVG
jgi:dTDP-4-amino-4,6-dideoxygalactose transaminase